MGFNTDGCAMIDEYRELVRSAVRTRSGEPVYNGSVEHATVLAETFFSNAEREVCILSGDLNPRVYGNPEVVRQAKLFLADAGHSAKFLIEDENNLDFKNHPFLEGVKDFSNVEFRVVPTVVQKSYNYHFMTMDDDSYRFEQDRAKTQAIAAFGDIKGAKNIKGIFSILWNASKPLAYN